MKDLDEDRDLLALTGRSHMSHTMKSRETPRPNMKKDGVWAGDKTEWTIT